MLIIWFTLMVRVKSAIMPPPWADPSSNPCAAQPRGWQLLFWPPDGKCYKIFQAGAAFSLYRVIGVFLIECTLENQFFFYTSFFFFLFH